MRSGIFQAKSFFKWENPPPFDLFRSFGELTCQTEQVKIHFF